MMENKKLHLEGQVEHIIYQNSANGYTVLNVECDDGNFTAVGNMPFVCVGETLDLSGEFKAHPKFGEQFLVETFDKIMPNTSDSILAYLSSGAVKGIGIVTAERLVAAFGDDTLDVLQHDPDKLCCIKGITPKKAQKLSQSFNSIFGMREVIESLTKFGLEANEAIKAYRLWGDETVDTIKFDPYCLCNQPLCLEFQKADNIASNLEYENKDICRLRAGISHVLLHNQNNGHTCLPYDKLVCVSADFLDVDPKYIESTIKEMVDSETLILTKLEDKDFLFAHEMFEAEKSIAERITLMLKFPPQAIVGIGSEIESIEKIEGIKYAELQKKAITDALKTGLLVLTGGPGTGKTTTLKGIINILSLGGERVFLAAPTGRAAKRMSELTGKDAKTIHRMLEVAWDKDDNPIFNRNERNPLECDALIVDELSMIDTLLFDSLLKALPLGCRLILVGDTNQLPCVGAGNVLGDLISSNILPVVTLDEIFRQSSKSLIITNAHKIVNGEMPDLTSNNSDFFFMKNYDPTIISDTIIDLCSRRLPKAYSITPTDVQVLVPSKRGIVGTNQLNERLQETLNPPAQDKLEINLNGKIVRQGDKVMQVKNNYDISFERDNGEIGSGIFNGDIGTLIEISKDKSAVFVRFDDKIAVYGLEQAADLELAYAMTVHKSQGSEFDAVVIPMYQGPPMLYYRNLLYTAVTRAKHLLVLVGNENIVAKMVNNNRKSKRYSGLSQAICNEYLK